MAGKACPACGSEMKVNEHGVYVCPNCKGVFIPKSLIGIHE
jgi:predicted RNA-binding Zn-ribbon protein involved in translation (DUF1610 family)